MENQNEAFAKNSGQKKVDPLFLAELAIVVNSSVSSLFVSPHAWLLLLAKFLAC